MALTDIMESIEKLVMESMKAMVLPEYEFEKPQKIDAIAKYKDEIALKAQTDENNQDYTVKNGKYLLKKSDVARAALQAMIDAIIQIVDIFCICGMNLFSDNEGATRVMQLIMSE